MLGTAGWFGGYVTLRALLSDMGYVCNSLRRICT